LWVVGGAVLVLIVALLLPKPDALSGRQTKLGDSPAEADSAKVLGGDRWRAVGPRLGERTLRADQTASAEQIVAGKLSQFARGRHEIAQRMAKRFGVELTEDVERFFHAVEAGQWEKSQKLFDLLKRQRDSGGSDGEGLRKLWGPIMETFGVAEEAHNWPAQTLLDYGHAVMDSLRPGMVYLGGTDPGRFIPTLLNETAEGEHHIILTQNAMADNSYLQYASFLYGDQKPMLDEQDSERAFKEYLSDAQKRLDHDQQFPDEPRQVRPGEDIRTTDGRLQVSGQVAVMAINERLVQMLMEKNPDVSFAIEQSFPLQSTYAGATTLGPIMELRVQDGQNALTPERAAQAVDYWQTTAQQVLSDPGVEDSLWVRKAWSKMASEQAALLLSQNYTAEAEAGFRVANELCPSSPEAVFRYVDLLVKQKRFDEAIQVADKGARADPENGQLRGLVEQLRTVKRN
jgi:tetratricopeptide (TPR) repeat protein